MVLPMRFLDDLNLTKCAYLTKHYSVKHRTQTDNGYVHYEIKRRDAESQDDKQVDKSICRADWAVNIKVTGSFTFDFNEQD